MKIDILDSDYPRLQALAEPFVDSPATVVSKLLDLYEQAHPGQTISPKSSREGVYLLNGLPPLTHAKVMGGHFNGAKPQKQNWDSFVRHALIEVLKKSGSVDELRRLSGANIREGHF